MKFKLGYDGFHPALIFEDGTSILATSFEVEMTELLLDLYKMLKDGISNDYCLVLNQPEPDQWIEKLKKILIIDK